MIERKDVLVAKFYYGGQAVIEGVMMRGRQSVAVAMRLQDGDIYVYEEPLNPKLYQNKWLRLPFLRGILLLWEMLVLGTRLMTFSANISTGALRPDEVQAPSVQPQPQAAPVGPAAVAGEGENNGTSAVVPQEEERMPMLGGWALAVTLIISLGFAIGIFFIVPLVVASLFRQQVGEGWLNLLIEGVVRLALLVIYLYAIGRIRDIQRVFGYHGAEHKAINAMEQGQPLDIPHVRLASRVHTRCGTGFLLLVMVVSIFVFALVGAPSLPVKILSRIVLIPVIAGVSYELMRLGAAYYRFRVVRWLLAPGLALQGLTTREPEDGMLECAIAALQRVLARDQASQPHHEQKPGDAPTGISSLTAP